MVDSALSLFFLIRRTACSSLFSSSWVTNTGKQAAVATSYHHECVRRLLSQATTSTSCMYKWSVFKIKKTGNDGGGRRFFPWFLIISYLYSIVTNCNWFTAALLPIRLLPVFLSCFLYFFLFYLRCTHHRRDRQDDRKWVTQAFVQHWTAPLVQSLPHLSSTRSLSLFLSLTLSFLGGVLKWYLLHIPLLRPLTDLEWIES